MQTAECGITHNTARAWITVLEASTVIFLLGSHHANFNKRKRPGGSGCR